MALNLCWRPVHRAKHNISADSTIIGIGSCKETKQLLFTPFRYLALKHEPRNELTPPAAIL